MQSILIHLLRKIVGIGAHGRLYKASLLITTISLFSSFLASILGDIYVRSANPLIDPLVWIFLAASVFTFVWWTTTSEKCNSWPMRKLFRQTFRNPKIGILSVEGVPAGEIRSRLRSTEYTPNYWLDEISKLGFDTKIISPKEVGSDYQLIINPFGELFPEEDLANMRTFRAIKDYVCRGGVFVNVGGLAFFYMRNFETKIEGLTGPELTYYVGGSIMTSKPLQGVVAQYKSPISILEPNIMPTASSLVDTCLSRNFGVKTTLGTPDILPIYSVEDSYFADIASSLNVVNVKEFRSAVRCESTNTHLIPMLRARYKYKLPNEKEVDHECYPIAAAKYGCGYLVLVGMVLEVTRTIEARLVIETINRMQRKMSQKGHLEQQWVSLPP